jgi:hypothetical protein
MRFPASVSTAIQGAGSVTAAATPSMATVMVATTAVAASFAAAPQPHNTHRVTTLAYAQTAARKGDRSRSKTTPSTRAGDITKYGSSRSHAGATPSTTVALPAGTRTAGGDAATAADPNQSAPALDTIPPTTDTTVPDPVVTNPVTVSIGDVAVPEGDTGTRVLAFPVTLSQPSDTTVSVQYSVTRASTSGASPKVTSKSSSASTVNKSDDGSSSHTGSGTAFKTGTVTFTPTSSGTTAIAKKIGVTIQSDTIVEPDETFIVTLSNPTGATLGRSIATGTVLNDDGVTTGITVGVGDVSVVRTHARPILLTMPVWLSAPATDPVSVGFTTNDGTRTWSSAGKGGGDYGGDTTSGVLDFEAGTVVQYIQLKIWPAASPRPDRSFTISLTSSDGGTTVLRSLGTVTILGS